MPLYRSLKMRVRSKLRLSLLRHGQLSHPRLGVQFKSLDGATYDTKLKRQASACSSWGNTSSDWWCSLVGLGNNYYSERSGRGYQRAKAQCYSSYSGEGSCVRSRGYQTSE